MFRVALMKTRDEVQVRHMPPGPCAPRGPLCRSVAGNFSAPMRHLATTAVVVLCAAQHAHAESKAALLTRLLTNYGPKNIEPTVAQAENDAKATGQTCLCFLCACECVTVYVASVCRHRASFDRGCECGVVETSNGGQMCWLAFIWALV